MYFIYYILAHVFMLGTNQQIAFSRGSSRFLVINNANSVWTEAFTTPLTANSYCDMIYREAARGGKCTGASYTVSEGSLIAAISERPVIGLFVGVIEAGSNRDNESNEGGGGSTMVSF
ncbi:hypothetical protein B0J17DRAFT_633944 [Rhizoctonia solani]|nr:hypothetical protein B0J17DRAFT_633944 [Rhizoctonia solani]